MTRAYLVPAESTEVEDVVRRSRFVTRAARAASRGDAARFVQETRDRLPGATHYCWAYNAGEPGSTARVGMSDAGEPHGTAGMPMLTVLLHSGVGEVVAVCARYFGGVKLGKGGLARAYASGVRHVLRECPTVERIERTGVVVTVEYGASSRVEHVLEELGAIVTRRDFDAAVRYRILVPSNRRADLSAAIANVTGGRAHLAEDPPDS